MHHRNMLVHPAVGSVA